MNAWAIADDSLHFFVLHGKFDEEKRGDKIRITKVVSKTDWRVGLSR